MAIVVRCPRCAKSYRISTEVVGRRVQCRCGEMFEATAASTDDAAAAPATNAASPPKDAPSAAAPTPAGQGAELHVEQSGGVTIVRVLPARIDSENVEAIGAALLALADDPANKRMVLNLAAVEFLFSTALGKI